MSVETISLVPGPVVPSDPQQLVVNQAEGSCQVSKFAGVLRQISCQEVQPRDQTAGEESADMPTTGEATSAQKRKLLSLTNMVIFPTLTSPPSHVGPSEDSLSGLSIASTSDVVGQGTSSELANRNPSKGQWTNLSSAVAFQTLSLDAGEQVEALVSLHATPQSSEGLTVMSTPPGVPESAKMVGTLTVSAAESEFGELNKAAGAQKLDVSSILAVSKGVSFPSSGPLGSDLSRVLTSTGGRASIKTAPTRPVGDDAEPAVAQVTQEVRQGQAKTEGLRSASRFVDLPSESHAKISPVPTGARVSDGFPLPADSNLSHEAMPLTKRIAPKNSLKPDPIGYQQSVASLPSLDEITATGLPDSGKANLTQQLEKMIDQVKQVHLSAGQATEMQVLLEPKELGKLALKISLENGMVTAHFDADSQIVKQLIEAQLPGLKDILSQQGIQLEQVSVQVAADSSGGFRHPTHEPPTRHQLRKGNRLPASSQIENIAVRPSSWMTSGHSFDFIV